MGGKVRYKMNTLNIIAGNVCSLIGMACDSVSASVKSVKAVLVWQGLGQLVYCIGSVVLKGYSGAVQSFVSILRNLAAIFNLKSRFIQWGLIIFGIVFGLYVNNRGLAGLLPVIANSQYSIAIFKFKDNERALKISFLFCVALFSAFNLFIYNFVGTVTNAVVFISTAAYLVKTRPQQKNK